MDSRLIRQPLEFNEELGGEINSLLVGALALLRDVWVKYQLQKVRNNLDRHHGSAVLLFGALLLVDCVEFRAHCQPEFEEELLLLCLPEQLPTLLLNTERRLLVLLIRRASALLLRLLVFGRQDAEYIKHIQQLRRFLQVQHFIDEQNFVRPVHVASLELLLGLKEDLDRLVDVFLELLVG